MSTSQQIGLVTTMMLVALGWQAYQTPTFADLWLTRDQQGRLAYEARDFPQAAELFQDAMWAGTAGYAAGQYESAAVNFASSGNEVGAYNQGNALIKARKYRQSIDAFDLAVGEAPEWSDAADNLRLATYVQAYLERIREQSDTGDESELSADDFVFDNENKKGAEMTITNNSVLQAESAEKWMRTVDTDIRDFLRSRFALEASDQ